MDHELPSPIASGRTAEIFAAGPGRVLKLYRPGWPEAAAQLEFEIAQKLSTADVPAPAAFGIERVHDRTGITYELIAGPSMLDGLASRPWTFARHARTLATLHAGIHSKRVPGLRPYREDLQQDIRAASPLDQTYRDAALRLLDELPGGDALCHGDFHPANVILARSGPVVIDWPGASLGNPLADVARSLILMRFGPLAEPSLPRRLLFRAFSRLFAAYYLSHYLKLAGLADRHELRRWVTVCTTARLGEGIHEERAALLKSARRGLYLYAPFK